MDIERAHRVGFAGPSDRPILVRFQNFKTKTEILKKKKMNSRKQGL